MEELARELGAWKIDERIAFLSSGAPLRTPFGRGLRVIDSAPWNQKQLPARLRELDIGVVTSGAAAWPAMLTGCSAACGSPAAAARPWS